jgi:manganese/zinc/iron transport system permease protein
MFDFWILVTGSLIAISCSVLGCFLVLRKMAMIGDAISHAVLPGIVLAFLISGSRDSFWMLLGAAIIGLVTVYLIQAFHQLGLQSDASIGIVFTTLFAIGIILVSVYSKQIDLDLDCVLYGEIAYVPWNTLELGNHILGPKAVWMIGIVFTLILVVITLFYKQFKLICFDPALALSLGIPVVLFHYVMMSLVSITTVASFESVGAILVVGMLIIPASTAYLLTHKFHVMIIVSAITATLSTVLGYIAASWLDTSISGSMVTMSGFLFLLALLFSPQQGIISLQLKKLMKTIHMSGKVN